MMFQAIQIKNKMLTINHNQTQSVMYVNCNLMSLPLKFSRHWNEQSDIKPHTWSPEGRQHYQSALNVSRSETEREKNAFMGKTYSTEKLSNAERQVCLTDSFSSTLNWCLTWLRSISHVGSSLHDTRIICQLIYQRLSMSIVQIDLKKNSCWMLTNSDDGLDKCTLS